MTRIDLIRERHATLQQNKAQVEREAREELDIDEPPLKEDDGDDRDYMEYLPEDEI